MKSLLHIIFFFSLALFSQERITTESIDTIPFKADRITHIDNLGVFFYIDGSTFYKKEPNQNYTYSNVQLGEITSANAFNPLKINLFYKNFNTALILDNRLSEIYK